MPGGIAGRQHNPFFRLLDTCTIQPPCVHAAGIAPNTVHTDSASPPLTKWYAIGSVFEQQVHPLLLHRLQVFRLSVDTQKMFLTRLLSRGLLLKYTLLWRMRYVLVDKPTITSHGLLLRNSFDF